MAKAGDDSSTTWILLADAAHLAADACGYSPKLAGADLVRWLGEKKIRWRGELRGQRRDKDPGVGSPEFWRGGPSVQLLAPLSESRAQRTTWASASGRLVRVRSGERTTRPALLSRYGYYLIEVAREDVIAALPAAAQARMAERARKEVPIGSPPSPAAGAAVEAKTPQQWLHEAWDRWPKKPHEKLKGGYDERIHEHMQSESNDDKVDGVLKAETIRVRYYEHQKALRSVPPVK